MTTITVLGAGAMGSAITAPLTVAGHDVRLWGTHLDDHLIAAIEAGDPHPRTGVTAPSNLTLFRSSELGVALHGADIAVLAVSSPGVVGTTERMAPYLDGVRAIWLTSKGFAPDSSGRIQLLPQVMEDTLAGRAIPIVAIGGPCKANEVAAARPTAAIFAASESPERWTALAGTSSYRLASTTDRDGVELCAALKNVYAIALGVADGMGELGGQPFHDFKAAAFAQALAELRTLLEAEGADPWTALGLAGAGDLEVTGLSGRNKVYGTRIGRGQAAQAALAEMIAAEQTVEGVPAVKLATEFVEQRHPELVGALPLLFALRAVVHDAAPAATLIGAALPG